ncbi:hypothetical protein KP509_02G001400 [Ceratopteris richardii]|uniref:CCHC-type domain-containing protein n=1 Tax=Ceratopteris richardii TaxID=49495 RepID=A0A8T2V6T6_CERRI|nr:hypothetical protein KP509_02G001400 [Ceratopteris richardii]
MSIRAMIWVHMLRGLQVGACNWNIYGGHVKGALEFCKNKGYFLGADLCPGALEEDKDSVASCEKLLEQTEVNCLVCRKANHPHDLASVWGALFFNNGQEDEIVLDAEVIFSKSERERKAKFDTLFKVQQDRGGIVEPKKLEVIVPGMFVSVPSTRATESGSGLATASFELPESSSLSAPVVECESSQQDNILLSQGRQHVLGAETISENGRIPKSEGGVYPLNCGEEGHLARDCTVAAA